VPVVRFQNMPSRNVAKSGAFTSRTPVNNVHGVGPLADQVGATMLKPMPATVTARPSRVMFIALIGSDVSLVKIVVQMC